MLRWWRDGKGMVEQKQFPNWEFRVYKNLNLGKMLARTTQGERCGKKLAFVLIDFEEGCFNLLSLFHLSKMHVFVTCSSVSLKITTKITPRCKV